MFSIFSYEEYLKMNKEIEKMEKIIFKLSTLQQKYSDEEIDIINNILDKYKNNSYKRKTK